MISYELAKELKDAEFPQETKQPFKVDGGRLLFRHVSSGEEEESAYAPTLPELIEACGDDFYELKKVTKAATITSDWYAVSMTQGIHGGIFSTPEIAVARLWLALNVKPV